MWKKLFLFTVIIWMVSPAHSAVIECQWNAEMTNCMISNSTPITQPNEIITINGQPTNYVNLNTKYVLFSNQVINYIPTGLFTMFPNLQALGLHRFEATTMSTDSIPNCRELGMFTSRGGQFTNIPAGVLESCKSLVNLGFGENNVTTLDVDAFRGLTNLTSFQFHYSKISCIPLGLFRHNPLLSNINIHGNMIKVIDSNLFANLPFLNYIGLGSNLISYIPILNLTIPAVSSSGPTPQLFIDFSSNPSYAITPDFCSYFGGRTENSLIIQVNNISCVPNNAQIISITSSNCQNISSNLQNCFSNWTSSMTAPVTCGIQPPTTLAPSTVAPTSGSCPSDRICRYFLDQYNRYTCILDGVDSVLTSISGNHLITFADINVRRVVFTNSFLSRIPPILFQKFPSLEYLTVSNCSMSALNANTFTACGTLKYFDASNNFITTIDGASFKSCAALEVIDLTGNNFDMISGQLFVNNPTLKAVYINRPPAMVLV